MKTLTKKEWENIRSEKAYRLIEEVAPDKNIFNDIIPFLHEMRKYERQLQRLAEHSCNGYPKEVTEYRDGKMFRFSVEDTVWRAKCERQEERLVAKVSALAKEYNLQIDFQGDPRGMMFSLKTADGREISL